MSESHFISESVCVINFYRFSIDPRFAAQDFTVTVCSSEMLRKGPHRCPLESYLEIALKLPMKAVIRCQIFLAQPSKRRQSVIQPDKILISLKMERVLVEKFNGNDFYNWKVKIQLFLMSKNLWGIVDGSETNNAHRSHSIKCLGEKGRES